MPYIKPEVRAQFRKEADGGGNPSTITPGELNYELTWKLTKYIEFNGLSYQTINDIIGALESAKLEFYRRVVAPYEDTKINENGDVY